MSSRLGSNYNRVKPKKQAVSFFNHSRRNKLKFEESIDKMQENIDSVNDLSLKIRYMNTKIKFKNYKLKLNATDDNSDSSQMSQVDIVKNLHNNPTSKLSRNVQTFVSGKKLKSLVNSQNKAYEKYKRNETMNFLKLKSTKITPSFRSCSPQRVPKSDQQIMLDHIFHVNDKHNESKMNNLRQNITRNISTKAKSDLEGYLQAPEIMTRKNQILLKYIDKLNQDMKNHEVKSTTFKWCSRVLVKSSSKRFFSPRFENGQISVPRSCKTIQNSKMQSNTFYSLQSTPRENRI